MASFGRTVRGSDVFVCDEERVGASGSVGEVPGVGVETAVGGLDRCAAEDVLEDVEGDVGVGEPGCSGVPEAMPGEVRQVEIGDELIPFRRVPHGGGGEHATAGSGQ